MPSQTFELLILGSGAATPTTHRNPTAQLLNVAGRFFLIDCGEGTQKQLRRYKARFQSVNHIFISHLHGDHVLGLPGLLASMHLLGRKRALTVYGPKELEEMIRMIHQVSDMQLAYPLHFVATQPHTKQLLWEDDKVEVYSFPLKHRIATTGFLFKEKPLPRLIDKYKLEKLGISFSEIHKLKRGLHAIDHLGNIVENETVTIAPKKERSYAFCSDTKFFEELLQDITGVNLLYHESTFLEDKKDRAAQTFHSTAAQAAQVALRSGAEKLLLGHFSARYDQLDLFLEEAKPIFANTWLAREGEIFSV